MKILNYTPFAKTGVNTMLNDKTICRDASLSINELGPDESKRISNFDPWCDDLELSMKQAETLQQELLNLALVVGRNKKWAS